MEKKSSRWKFPVAFGCASTIFSAYCGSGFATGRQLVQFFARFGWIGTLTHLLTWILCIFGFIYGVEYHRRRHFYNYRDYATHFYWPRFGKVFVALWDILMVMTGFVMLSSILASAGSLLQEMTGGGRAVYWIAVVAMALCIILAACFGSMILMKFASVITVCMLLIITIIGIMGIARQPQEIASVLSNRVVTEGPGYGWWPAIWASLSYFGMQGNTLASCGGLSRNFRSKRDTIWGVAGGFFLCALMTMIFVLMLLGRYPGVINETLPVLEVVRTFGSPAFTVLYQILLLAAMVTTGASFTFGFTERMSVYGKKLVPKDSLRKGIIIAVLLAGGMILSSLGLMTIVAKGYSLIGGLSLPLMTLPLLFWAPHRIHQLNHKYGKDADAPLEPKQ